MYEIHSTGINDCVEIQPRVFEDERGRFVKPFNKEYFSSHNLESNFSEEYYSVSKNGVLRGLHFQLPPMDHAKLVYCVEGCVLDAVVDLRVNSPSYGKHVLLQLDSVKANSIYIPKGFAHGFYVLSDYAILVYKVSTVYSPKHDTGILWNSAGIPWPSENPVLSERDNSFLSLKDFKSPFTHG